MPHRPLVQVTAPRAVAAASFLCVAATFASNVAGFLTDGHEAGDGFVAMARWPVYELVASTYAIVLPLSHLVRRWASRIGRRALAIGLLVPFTGIAWLVCEPVFGATWVLAAFLALALVHWISFECEEVRVALMPAVSPLRRSVMSFAKCYGLAMVAGFLALLVVLGPMDILGVFVSDRVRLEFLSVAVGTFYFALIAVTELIDLDGFIDSQIAESSATAEREREWRGRAARGDARTADLVELPAGPQRLEEREHVASPHLSPAREQVNAFEDWIAALPVSNTVRKRVQYADHGLLRFGTPPRARTRDRRLSFAGALVSCVMTALFLLVAFHPQSFKKKYARPSNSRRFTKATEQSDRDAFKVMAVLALLVGTAMGITWWRLRKNELGAALATIDRRSGTVTGPGGRVVVIATSRLQIEAAVPTPHGTSDRWNLVVCGQDGDPLPLVSDVSLRDAELVAAVLATFGFQASERPSPEPIATG